MATLRLKPGTKPTEAKAKQTPGSLSVIKSADGKYQVATVAAAPAPPYASLREYLKTSH
jgi:hypothetical protein